MTLHAIGVTSFEEKYGVDFEALVKNLNNRYDAANSDWHGGISGLGDTTFLKANNVYSGYAEDLLDSLEPDSIALSVWSPPYNVGKDYERGQSHTEWRSMLEKVIAKHTRVIKPGAFLAINIADILCFPDPEMPRIQLPNPTKHRSSITKEDVLRAKDKFPKYNRDQLAKYLGCSEQTVDRRLNGNNIRGGKYNVQTRIQLVGNVIQDFAQSAGLFLYDRRIWKKDAAWANSQWHSSSYRSVDEFEYIYIFWKPGETVVDRNRIEKHEWAEWGSRGVWDIPSVRSNDHHEAMFPKELPSRCIRLLTSPRDIVLDPFMGSGTTAIAALELGRKYIGFEKEEKYVRLAKQKIQESLRQPSLFSRDLSSADVML
jgi:site-specific DNA-methyltransferase (adenine-specific)